jgi:hypothetical protein
VRDSQKTPINARPSPAAPAAASPEGRGDDAPLVNITTVGAIHESPATLKTTKATKAKATFVQPSPSPLPEGEGGNVNLSPEAFAYLQAQLVHVYGTADPHQLQTQLSAEDWQLVAPFLSAKQERAG